MPATAIDLSVADGRIIRINGLPDFNAQDRRFIISELQGWDDGPTPEPVLVANGGGPGKLAAGDWEALEAYYTFLGSIEVDDLADLRKYRKLLIGAFPYKKQASVVMEDPYGQDVQVFVRLYDKPTFNPHGRTLDFEIPVVAPDPYKYGMSPIVEQMGVWTGESWYREYTSNVGIWERYYQQDASGRWVRYYQQSVPDSLYPPSAVIDSDGDQISRRVISRVTGPVTAGEWFLTNEATGERLWAELSVTSDQTLVFDSINETATLNGSPVEHLTFGDWLTLPPGRSTFRLVSGTPSAGYGEVEALEAYS